MIILEGFDGAGKSTLANKLRFPVLHAGGPPKDDLTLKTCLRDQMIQCGQRVVLDRVTCISHQVYGHRMHDPILVAFLHEMLRCKNTVLVYCRPPTDLLMDFSNHEAKAHDSEEHLRDIEANMRVYISRYDELMSSVEHQVYDYTQHGNDIGYINKLIQSQLRNLK